LVTYGFNPHLPDLNEINTLNKNLNMLIIKKGEKESIDKVLKRYKRKCRETRLLKDIRARKEFVKPSVTKRKTKQKAVYLQKQQNKWNQ